MLSIDKDLSFLKLTKKSLWKISSPLFILHISFKSLVPIPPIIIQGDALFVKNGCLQSLIIFTVGHVISIFTKNVQPV